MKERKTAIVYELKIVNNLRDSEIADTLLDGTADNASRSSEDEEPAKDKVSM